MQWLEPSVIYAARRQDKNSYNRLLRDIANGFNSRYKLGAILMGQLDIFESVIIFLCAGVVMVPIAQKNSFRGGTGLPSRRDCDRAICIWLYP